MGLAFTQTLANVYMFEWEQPLVEYQQLLDERYGRCIDDDFMATNLPRDQIIAKLDKVHNSDPNIRITYTVKSAVDFLDVAIENNDRQLKTVVFQKPSAEPYVLPYTSDHPHHVHLNIPYADLLRVARLCSNVEDFEIERINIEMSLLLNGYPPKSIRKQFHRFFDLNNTLPVLKQLDAESYQQLHQKLLYQLFSIPLGHESSDDPRCYGEICHGS
ncbi:unnamed protein product [Rotaria socialis]|uniref:Helix-turn-helix domain-containing protein n=1 Tax=Rotaria socialis TaxID=392032 RepID=A0A818AL27_9BILA|nr:unnamed protein product [Rotaria socialis]CAF4519924.1 unnamed protein product [Rotaria socialis]